MVKSYLPQLTFLMLTCSLCAQVGVNTPNPEQALDVAGKIKVSDDNMTPTDGTMRYNSAEGAFGGFSEGEWSSFNSGESLSDVETLHFRYWG